MGREKERWMAQDELGYMALGGYVCPDCITAEEIKDYIRCMAEAQKCDFCGQTSNDEIAASFSEVTRIIVGGIKFEWNDADRENIPYESREDGYLLDLSDTNDLIFEFSENDLVKAALLDSIGERKWVHKNYCRESDEERFQSHWQAFRHQIMHEKRFYFSIGRKKKPYHREIEPSKFLLELKKS